MKQNSPPFTTSQKNNRNSPDVIDAMFDNVCPVPDNLGEAVAKEEITLPTEQPPADSKSFMMDNPAPTETAPEIAEDSDKNGEEDNTMEKVLSKFDMNCCAKNTTKQTEDSNAETLKGDDATDVNGDDPSLSEIAARMNDIDLESGGENAAGDFNANLTKPLIPWYREPFYASLIVLCTLFTIAIIVMASLLFKK